MDQQYFTYILASDSAVLYIGMTNDLARRIREHKEGIIVGFSKKYKCHKLVYFESTPYVYNAIEREKEIKGWRREKKIALINTNNPGWKDLYQDLL